VLEKCDFNPTGEQDVAGKDALVFESRKRA